MHPHVPPDHHPRHEHHEHTKIPRRRAGAENLPLETLPPERSITVPVAPPAGLLPGVSVEIANEDPLGDKPIPKRRYDLHNLHEVRGAVMVWFRWLF